MHVYRCVAWQQTSCTSVLLLGADHMENSFPSIVACIRVYKAVGWQSVDEIHYIMFNQSSRAGKFPLKFQKFLLLFIVITYIIRQIWWRILILFLLFNIRSSFLFLLSCPAFLLRLLSVVTSFSSSFYSPIL
jgi:hypothetical protein